MTTPHHPPMMPQMPQIPGGIPLVGHGPSREEQARAGILQAANQMSLAMYSELAIRHIAMRDDHEDVCAEDLRQLAKHCQLAAKAYFVGLGICTFDD